MRHKAEEVSGPQGYNRIISSNIIIAQAGVRSWSIEKAGGRLGLNTSNIAPLAI